MLAKLLYRLGHDWVIDKENKDIETHLNLYAHRVTMLDIAAFGQMVQNLPFSQRTDIICRRTFLRFEQSQEAMLILLDIYRNLDLTPEEKQQQINVIARGKAVPISFFMLFNFSKVGITQRPSLANFWEYQKNRKALVQQFTRTIRGQINELEAMLARVSENKPL